MTYGQVWHEFVDGVRRDYMPVEMVVSPAEYDSEGIEIQARVVKSGYWIIVRTAARIPALENRSECKLVTDHEEARQGRAFIRKKGAGPWSDVQAIRRPVFAGDSYPMGDDVSEENLIAA